MALIPLAFDSRVFVLKSLNIKYRQTGTVEIDSKVGCSVRLGNGWVFSLQIPLIN